MSDISAVLAVGYRLTHYELARVFGAEIPERSHFEDRYDPKTGKNLGPQKIVDEKAGFRFVFNGRRYHSANALISALSDAIGCAVWECSIYGAKSDYVFGPNFQTDTATSYSGDTEIILGGELSFPELEDLKPEIIRIGARLQEFGLTLEEPKVQVACVSI